MSTMKSTLISILLLISSLTVSYAQTGDTLTCYNNSELKKITTRVVRAKECDTLLQLAEYQLGVKDSIITTQSTVIAVKDSVISLKDSIITKHDSIVYQKDLYIEDLELQVKKSERKLKWTKTGWIATTIGLVTLWLASVL